jgi:glycosyltransferase involved in cell wall biosynthesis
MAPNVSGSSTSDNIKEGGVLPKISVVVPSLNMAGFIGETIESIVGQDYPNIECIVTDGGSNDGTLDILKKYGDRISWISEKDSGQSEAINKGLKKATGDICAYLNADDVYEPGCFRRVANCFTKNTAAKWLYGKCTIIDEKGAEIRKPITRYKNFWQKRYSYNWLLVQDFIAQPAVFWRRELTEEMGLFDVKEHIAMDYDYWLRAGAKYRPGFIDDYLARFRLHPVSKSATGYVKAARTALNLGRKYAALEKRNFMLPLQYVNCGAVIAIYSIFNLLASRNGMAGKPDKLV